MLIKLLNLVSWLGCAGRNDLTMRGQQQLSEI